MGAVENSLTVLPVQTCTTPADEPRILCIVRNMVETAGQTCQTYSINLPMSLSCQTLIDDVKSKFEHLPEEISIVYRKPAEGGTTVSISINECPEKAIGEICLQGGKSLFFVYSTDSLSLKEDSVVTPAVKPNPVISNDPHESSSQSNIISQVSSVEPGCRDKDSYACSASTSYSSYPFGLSSLSKSDTGYVGLVNQAMTCYLNSLLQTLYMTPEFRNAVYRWKFDGMDTDALHCIPYQLQRLFLQLQTSNKRAVETTDITRSFGWDSSEAWHQHDIQEMCRVMFDALEQTWKSTDQENLINELYQGKMKDYVRCFKCRSVRARLDTYLDLPLVIRPYGSEIGYGSVEQALRAFEEPELLEGNNQYFCENCGQHCDAHKGLQIVSFPYILTLHLKRFGFDHCTYQRFKLNDRMTFPEILKFNLHADESENNEEMSELTKEKDSNEAVIHVEHEAADNEDVIEDEGIDTGEGISNHSNKTSDVETEEVEASLKHVSHEYQLYSVMIHSGNAVGGHYYAYIRSFKDGQWYSFNDQHVFKISEDDMERTFGGSLGPSTSYSSFSSSTNAYMLQYRLIDPARNRDFMDEVDFPDHLRAELASIYKKEEEELQRQELDRNTCKIKLFFYNETRESYTEHRFEVHKSKTLAEATEMARQQLELTDVPLDCVRLVKFDGVHDYVEQSFDGEEMRTMCCLLGGVRSSYHFDLLLETRKLDEEFPIHFRGGIVVRLHVVDLLQEDIHCPKMLRILPGKSVRSLMLLISQSFDLSFSTMTLVLDRGYANFCPLLDPARTLSEEGFERVNRVFIECSGAEIYDTCFPATKLCKILYRFVNTISLVIALPSLNEIARMDASLLRSYYLNRPDFKDSSPVSLSAADAEPFDKKLADIDEGIGESESDIHSRTCATETTSEMDLSAMCGAGNNEVMSRTSDWCSSICSNELSHDASERCANFVASEEVPGDSKEMNVGFGAGETLQRKANLGLESSEETTNKDGSDVFRGGAEASSDPEASLISCPGSPDAFLDDDTQTVRDSSLPFRSHDDGDELVPGFDCDEGASGQIEGELNSDSCNVTTEETDDFPLDCPTPATSPRVSSNGSNSPEAENENEVMCPSDTEEICNANERSAVVQESDFAYFRVTSEISGVFEQTLNVEVDRRMFVSQLKSKLEPYLGTSADNFRVFRYSPMGPDVEMTRLYDQLHSVSNGSKLIIKLGRALKLGELKLSAYQLLVHEPEPIRFLVEVIVQKKITLRNLKRVIINEVRNHCGMEIPAERCRLRRKSWKNPSGIFTNDAVLHDLLADATITELFVEVLENGPDRMEVEQRTLLQVYLRRWRPSTYQLDPVQELILSDWTLANIRKEISLMSGIDEENVSISKMRGQFPCNIPVLDVEDEAQWDPPIVEISSFPMAVADDGAVLFYKDRTELLAPLTDEQKRDVQDKESAKSQKMRPAVKVPNKVERPLKIYTAADHSGRPNSLPI